MTLAATVALLLVERRLAQSPSFPAHLLRAVPGAAARGPRGWSSPAEYVERELLPTLEHGKLVLSEMGHVDVARLEHEAFEHAAVRFLRDGVVDTSKFVRLAIDFTPEERLQDVARALFPRDAR